jgi:hypothetical protein
VGDDATRVPSGEGRGESEEGNWKGERRIRLLYEEERRERTFGFSASFLSCMLMGAPSARGPSV